MSETSAHEAHQGAASSTTSTPGVDELHISLVRITQTLDVILERQDGFNQRLGQVEHSGLISAPLDQGSMTLPSVLGPGPTTTPSILGPGPTSTPSVLGPGPTTTPSALGQGPTPTSSALGQGPTTFPSASVHDPPPHPFVNTRR
ncbi:unnamed protein product [Tilletia controversa]|uniref:Uncharacterized protein n=3 Tax=Tilletia TaxID=13289 RepID=A0A8X7MTD0_9BASI|nr:hypothetical protein CF336_g6455 [Tilletia laevis]KAE8190354.1 hypothetical protein CF328_g5998 [Tilletia controversa]KAE8251852.1 hypothetical protein A4X03_0g6303 [Tilletia caries]KAE8192715.1 hypothetical protein CF335_g5772 [Tilletia laevis]KAE8248275.1 hypothetical protein A4X06_0g3835 [Tilletia controversa]